MTKFSKHMAIMGIAALVGCGAAGASIAHDSNDAATPLNADGWGCEIRTETKNGMLMLESVVLTEHDVAGSYRLKVKGRGNGGSTNVSQGGGFDAAAHADTVLGTMMLSAGKAYDVALDVKIGNKTEACSAKV